MPLTPKFRKMKLAMQKTYGKKRGTSIAYATARKKGIKIHTLRRK